MIFAFNKPPTYYSEYIRYVWHYSNYIRVGGGADIVRIYVGLYFIQKYSA